MTAEDQAFKWLKDRGYPLAAMSQQKGFTVFFQQKGFTVFFLGPILAEYAAFLEAQGEHHENRTETEGQAESSTGRRPLTESA